MLKIILTMLKNHGQNCPKGSKKKQGRKKMHFFKNFFNFCAKNIPFERYYTVPRLLF
jgi:quinol-cytochrome oxidoreductase complex cytochrome b subunit